jgi:hypothetical protein
LSSALAAYALVVSEPKKSVPAATRFVPTSWPFAGSSPRAATWTVAFSGSSFSTATTVVPSVKARTRVFDV